MGDHVVNESCKDRFVRIESEIKEVTDRVNKGAERLVIAEQSTKSAHHRIDAIEEQTEAVTRLAVSVEHIATQNQEILKEMKVQRDDIIILKNKPAQDVYNYWKLFLGALVTGAAGVLIGLLANKG